MSLDKAKGSKFINFSYSAIDPVTKSDSMHNATVNLIENYSNTLKA